MARPALPCPPWCKIEHAPEGGQHHQRLVYDNADIVGSHSHAALILTDYGDDTPILADFNGVLHLHVTAGPSGSGETSTVMVSLDDREGRRQAKDLSAVLEALGHGSLAAAIDQLLALVTDEENPDG